MRMQRKIEMQLSIVNLLKENLEMWKSETEEN